MNRTSITLLLCAALMAGCSQREQDWRLPKNLSEVSGLATYNQQLLLHDDETAAVYRFNVENGAFELVFRIGQPTLSDDFEGITVDGTDVLLVNSKGTLYRVSGGAEMQNQTVEAELAESGLADVCEIEGLDLSEMGLLLACKENYQVGQDRLLIYRFLNGRSELLLEIDLEATGVGKFKPSAIEYQNGKFYVLSAKPKKLLQISEEGVVEAVRKLDGLGLKQPEGLSFVNGELYIASEDPKGGIIKPLEVSSGTP